MSVLKDFNNVINNKDNENNNNNDKGDKLKNNNNTGRYSVCAGKVYSMNKDEKDKEKEKEKEKKVVRKVNVKN